MRRLPILCLLTLAIVSFSQPGFSQASGLNFASAVAYDAGGSTPSFVVAADLNGDGNPDLVVANQCAGATNNCNLGSVSVLLGNGDGTFGTPTNFSSGGFIPESIAVADVNGDGKLDLVVANRAYTGEGVTDSTDGAVGVLLGNGDGTFQAPVLYDSGGLVANSVAVADVDGDGKPDIVVGNLFASRSNKSNSTIGVLLGNGDGTFQTAATYSTGGLGSFVTDFGDETVVAVADLNGDGKPDVVVTTGCPVGGCGSSGEVVGILLGNGDGTFQTAVTYGAGEGPDSVAVADLNGDGNPDLVVGDIGCSVGRPCVGGSVSVLLGDGNGTFRAPVNYKSGGLNGDSVAVADVNGDGQLDVVVGSECGLQEIGDGCSFPESPGTVGVLLGNGDGTLQPVVPFQVSQVIRLSSVAVSDINRDGKPDLLAVGCSNTDGQCIGEGMAEVLINESISATTTGLVSSLNPSHIKQPVTFTAIVPPQGKGTPMGIVTFVCGGTKLGVSPLNRSGVATLTTSKLAVGSHRVTATYSGDANHPSSTSPVLN